ncbi:TetR/AcrR family transcriptional regulator [Micromonospora mirobrigensis]|uniref:Transcriptional regulator, TetR family n=1 Tax=Micromonospora mirobrigensis TaxID=262898 RepID=A0A1C5ALN1_9ACTN|nr:TetR/AcrR family transcriptional regulator [Micromonospora mirobrigensis]SCF45914.1 transcriptional regulator, TetR family [Micromonospora mirobrigensis]
MVKALATDETPTRIRTAAVRLFARWGFAAVGIRDLANEAGINSATLYHHFGSKDDLLLDIMRVGLVELLEMEQQAVASQRKPAARLAALVHVHVIAHALAAESCRVVDQEIRALRSEHRSEIVELRDRIEQLWRSVISEGMKAGVFRTTVPAPMTALALLDMATGISRWFDADGVTTADDFAQQYVDVALRAVDARRSKSPSAARVLGSDLYDSVARTWDVRRLAQVGGVRR